MATVYLYWLEQHRTKVGRQARLQGTLQGCIVALFLSVVFFSLSQFRIYYIVVHHAFRCLRPQAYRV